MGLCIEYLPSAPSWPHVILSRGGGSVRVAHLFGDCLLESLILLSMSSLWRWSVSTGLFMVTEGLPNGMCSDKLVMDPHLHVVCSFSL